MELRVESVPKIEYPVALGLHGKHCSRCWHYVSWEATHCDLCHYPVGPVVKIREHGEMMAGSRAYCGSTE